MAFKILLVDDNQINRVLIETYLTEQNLSLTIVEDGSQAVEQVRANTFNLILMDLEMPIMNGWEAVKAIRALKVFTPIIAFTANQKPKDVTLFREAGFNGFVSKPVDEKTLIKTINRYR